MKDFQVIFGGTALRAVPEMGDYGGDAPVIPHFCVCEAYAPSKIIRYLRLCGYMPIKVLTWNMLFNTIM